MVEQNNEVFFFFLKKKKETHSLALPLYTIP